MTPEQRQQLNERAYQALHNSDARNAPRVAISSIVHEVVEGVAELLEQADNDPREAPGDYGQIARWLRAKR